MAKYTPSKYTPTSLIGYVQIDITIKCTKCDEEDNYMNVNTTSIDSFFKKGWRATDKHCYCPACAKKYHLK